MKLITAILSACLVVCSAAAVSFAADPAKGLEPGIYARFETSRGEIVARLFYRQTPMTVINFAGLAEGTKDSNMEKGKKYYDGLTFHRVIPKFMIQGGDPQGNGSGGPGYQFPDEIVKDLRHDSAGILSMANAGRGTNGSQFFITHLATPWLDGKHTVFGKVVKGQEVVDAIEKGDKINHLTILRIGDEAKAFKTDEAAFRAHIKKLRDDKMAVIRKAQERFETEMALKYPELVKKQPGFMQVELAPGAGPIPEPGAKVMVHVTSKLKGGQLVSTTEKEGPVEITAGNGDMVTETVVTMKKGGKRALLISWTLLAYGETGYKTIPPKSDMIVEVELVEIK